MTETTPPRVGRLETVPALERPDLLAPPVADALRGWPHAGATGVVGIDPALADTAGWRLLVDSRVPQVAAAVIGSGVRRSKLLVPGPRLAELPGAEVVEGLAR